MIVRASRIYIFLADSQMNNMRASAWTPARPES